MQLTRYPLWMTRFLTRLPRPRRSRRRMCRKLKRLTHRWYRRTQRRTLP